MPRVLAPGAPVAGAAGGQFLTFDLRGPASETGVLSTVNVVCSEVSPDQSLAELTDWKRRHPDDAPTSSATRSSSTAPSARPSARRCA